MTRQRAGKQQRRLDARYVPRLAKGLEMIDLAIEQGHAEKWTVQQLAAHFGRVLGDWLDTYVVCEVLRVYK